MRQRLKGKHALVTGGAQGIGLATVSAFLEEGAKCSVGDLGLEPSVGLAQLLKSQAGRVRYVPTDVSRLDEVGLLLARAEEEFGPVEILFNNAAIFDLAPLLESDEKMYERLFSVNVKGMFFTMQKALAAMVKNQIKGSIINVSSQAGRRGEALVAHYCATKAAVISYSQSAALAMAPYQIRVNALAPGVIDTPMWQEVDALFAKYEGRELGEKKRLVGKAVPLGSMGKPSQVAELAVFLASAEASYITGRPLT